MKLVSRPAWLTVLAVVSLTAVGISPRILARPVAAVEQGQHRRSDLAGLPPLAQAKISASIGEDHPAFHAAAGGDGLRMNNDARGVSAEFTSEGVHFRSGSQRWGLSLRGYGYGAGLRRTPAVSPRSSANRVEYRRGELTEWYVNGPLGLEQGFTLARAPENPTGEPLTLAFATAGDLVATLDSGARSVTLRKDGSPALRYGGLFAVDAAGRELPAWLDVDGHELRVRVNDAGARYPLTIDPYVQAATLSTVMPCNPQGVCDDGAPFDQFAYSLSISADASTVVVGVPFKYTNSVARGAAYVFLRPSDFDGGWNSIRPIRFKAKLLASDGATNGLYLGYSVDISRNGATIVAGAPSLATSTVTGAVYVFERPASGWGTFAVQTQTAKPEPAREINVDTRGSVGEAVAITGDGKTVAGGAPHLRIDSIDRGGTYLFHRPETGWANVAHTQRFEGTEDSYYGFGLAFSDDGSTLVVGATGENPAGGVPDETGAAHVLVRHENPGSLPTYLSAARLAASAGVPLDIFGWSVGASGDGGTLVVGAPGYDSDTLQPHGAAYVFVKPASGWEAAGALLTETARLTTSDGNGADALGVFVDISADGNTIVATTNRQRRVTPEIPSAAYFFAQPAGGWTTTTEDTKVVSQNADHDWFGWSASLSGNGAVALIGAPGTTVDASLLQGTAYVFTGAAATPRASVSPESLVFASQPIGTASAAKTVTVSNTGSAPLQVTGVGASGPFVATQNCVTASPIAPGGSCSETVAFAPVSVGPHFGTLTFASNSGAGGGLHEVPLQGDGAKGNTTTTIVSVSNPVFVGGSATVSFEVSAAGGLSPSGTVTVQATTGESCTAGAISNGCILTFTTPGPRTVTATYNGSVNFNPSTSPGVVARAVDFSLSATPASQSVSGKKASFKLTVTGVGGLSGAVALSCAGGPPNTTCAVSPATLNVSGATADAKATVTLPNGAPKGTYVMTFAGAYAGVTRTATATVTVK